MFGARIIEGSRGEYVMAGLNRGWSFHGEMG
jgi:hypothetical protein